MPSPAIAIVGLACVYPDARTPAELWENVSPEHNHWITLRLEGTRSNRDGIGARIRLTTRDGTRYHHQYNQMTSAVGYASSSHDGVHFGLGKAETVEEIEIKWPSGTVQVLRNVRADQILKVREPCSAQQRQTK